MVGGAVAPLLINHASRDARFQTHPGLERYGIESYIAVPLSRRDGSYFGTLCALDTLPAQLSEENFIVLRLLAQLIAFELEADEHERRRESELRALEDFIAIAGHDLRQPFTALLGRAQLLARRARGGGPASDLLPGIETILFQARRAVQLSEKLLDIARLHTGEFQLDKQSIDLAALAQQAVEDAQMNAQNHTFRFEAPASLPWVGDPSRLGQVFRNLLDNAAKYSLAESGPVILLIEPGAAESGAAELQISVADAGIGVADDDLPHLFEHKYRATNASASGASGAGLGLYITRQIVEAHGGSVRAQHNAPQGLVIHLVLPAAAEERQPGSGSGGGQAEQDD